MNYIALPCIFKYCTVVLLWRVTCAIKMFATVLQVVTSSRLAQKFCRLGYVEDLNVNFIRIFNLAWSSVTKLCWAVQLSRVTVMQVTAVESQSWNWAMEYTMKIRHIPYVLLFFICCLQCFDSVVCMTGLRGLASSLKKTSFEKPFGWRLSKWVGYTMLFRQTVPTDTIPTDFGPTKLLWSNFTKLL